MATAWWSLWGKDFDAQVEAALEAEDIAGAITDLFRDAIIDSIDYIADTIELINTEIDVALYKAQQWLIDIWNDDVGFWAILGIGAATALAMPAITAGLASIASSAIVISLGSMIDDITGTVFKNVNFTLIETIHTFMTVFSPEYAAGWERLNTVLGNFLKTIKQPINTITLLFNDVRNIAMVATSFISPYTDTGEFEAYLSTETFLESINKKMEYYIRNPNAIYTDFRDQVQQPLYDDQNKALTTLQENITINAKRVLEATNSYSNLLTVVNKVTSDLPEAFYNERMDNIADWVQREERLMEAFHTYQDEVTIPILNTLEEGTERNRLLVEKMEREQLISNDIYADLGNDMNERLRQQGGIEAIRVFDMMGNMLQENEDA